MTKEEKLVVINSLAEQLEAYPHFYITAYPSTSIANTGFLPILL